MQSLLAPLEQSPTLMVGIVFIFGLMIGSFLNVVIYRLPVMMQRNWRKECLEYLQLPQEKPAQPFNLLFPGSNCPHCNALIKPLQNIPVLSYLRLKGRCAYCQAPISKRYPLIELFTAISSAVVAWHFGFTPQTLYALLLTWSLIALSFIDIDHQLLPDSITLPMLWLGLFLSLFGYFATPPDSIIGAIAGYLSLWSVYMGFKLLTGKEGMGYGDFKLLALFGAWLGWQSILMIVLMSSLVGALIGGGLIIFAKHNSQTPIPFGPYLAAAGWLTLIWGDAISEFYLNFSGL